MKRLLFILALLPLFTFGQGCSYGGSTNDASELCDFYRGNNFATDRNADIALDKVLSVTGMSKRFVLMPCNDISNCVATSYKGIRYILYDKGFMDAISTRTNSWSNLSILAHEVGHHVNGHSLDLVVYATDAVEAPTLSESRQMELEADEYSGFILYKLGASLSQAQEAVRLVSSYGDDTYSTHPSKDKRLEAIEKGYYNAKNQGADNNVYTNKSSTGTAEDYFYKAYNNESDYQYQIDNYTKCLSLDRDHAGAYNNRGVAKYELGNYNAAITDYTSAIRIDRDYAVAYNNRGNAKSNLGNYNAAITDFTSAIRIDRDYALAYNNRGISKYELGNSNAAIADFTSAIRIDRDLADAYYNRGIAKVSLGNYNAAITDYTSAIRIDRNHAGAYFNRGLVKWFYLSQLGYCSDYKKACDLGFEKGCELYSNQCR